jgi:hypothetical protein
MQARPGWLANSVAQVSPKGAVSLVYSHVQSWRSRDIAIDLIGYYARDSGSRTPVNYKYTILLCTRRTLEDVLEARPKRSRMSRKQGDWRLQLHCSSPQSRPRA